MQNIYRVFASSFVAVLALSACAATQQKTPLAEAKNVALGQQAYADGPIVQPVAVLEDSRSPQDVVCVWAGQVRVKMLWIRSGGRQQEFEVTLGKRTPIADGSILLERVAPARTTSTKAIKPADYRFDFRFDGGL